MIINIIEDKGTRITLETSSEVEATIHIARWYFPMWRCLINRSRHDVKEDEFGTLSIFVPPCSNQIVLMLFPSVLMTIWIVVECLEFLYVVFHSFPVKIFGMSFKEVVGKKLVALDKHRQIICIAHLP